MFKKNTLERDRREAGICDNEDKVGCFRKTFIMLIVIVAILGVVSIFRQLR